MMGMVLRWYIHYERFWDTWNDSCTCDGEFMWFIYPLMVPNESLSIMSLKMLQGKKERRDHYNTPAQHLSCSLNAFRSLYISNLIPGSTEANCMKCQYHTP